MLKFLGRGSAFHSQNNCGFFVKDRELVLMDCPMSAFHRIREIGFEKLVDGGPKCVTVFVTHTHSDHVGGIGMMIHYCYYILHLPVRVITANEKTEQNVEYLLRVLEGCCEEGYSLMTEQQAKKEYPWIVGAVETVHTPQLEGRCFGWVIQPEGTRIVFTGDTTTLEPFVPYLEKGTYLYTDASAHDCVVHMHIKDLEQIIPELRRKGVQVYFMHLDDEQLLGEAARKTGAEIAPLYT